MAEPGTHDIPDHRQGTTWSYEYDFAELGEDYLEDLAEAQFWTRQGSKYGTLGLNLSLTGAGDSEAALTVEGTVLRITPADPISLTPDTHFHGSKLIWANGTEVEPVEGKWRITKSGRPPLED